MQKCSCLDAVRLIAGLNALGLFTTEAFCLQIIYFFHVLFDYNLFEINISYGFGDIKAINLLCQQPSAQLINLKTRRDRDLSVPSALR